MTACRYGHEEGVGEALMGAVRHHEHMPALAADACKHAETRYDSNHLVGWGGGGYRW